MLLIFDLDGTLFKAKPVVLRTAEVFTRELGCDMPDERFIYKNAEKFLSTVLPDGADFIKMRSRYDELLYESVTRLGSLYPGVKSVLETLHREGHRLFLCSASGAGYIELALKVTGISEFFIACHSAGEFKTDCVARILADAGFKPANERAAVIGDTHGDIEAAQGNGISSIAVSYGYGNKKMLSGADYIANAPEDIINGVRILSKF